MGLLRAILNVVWLIFAGFWLAVAYVLAGVVMCILIVTIPFGIQAFKLGGYAFWPFGRTVVKRPDAGAPSFVGNVIWLVLAGWWLALAHLVTGIALCLTIIGIPLGIADFKLAGVALWPFGREIVSVEEAEAIEGESVAVPGSW
ncbi:MAG: YccF domain-containing protein [Solirubrobacteraceae bacterium]